MKTIRKRALAAALALAVTAGALVPAASAMTIPVTCDETYYATLDYYGQITEGSVIKSYCLNGATSVTDYGAYDEVVNLSDSLSPTVDGNTVTFALGEEAPEKFYFEGKTQKPFEDLPWKISVSYKLNGAPILAQDLAGKTGLVEIGLDVTLNPRAPEYSRNNLVLTAAAAFNDDDITSLEAPGAQVQMVGNLRAVLFMILPGEEQHFAIRVGSEDFSFTGLVLLAVPATLQQLEQVADLRAARDKGKDSLDAIGDSMDAILDAMEGMSGSLTAAAGGLDQLNSARSAVSGGKNGVYDKTDLALGDLNALADTLGVLDGYKDVTSQAVTDINGNLNAMNETVQGLKPELENTRKLIVDIQKDAEKLKKLLTDVESYNKEATSIASDLANNTDDLDEDLDDMQLKLHQLERALNSAGQLSRLDKITVELPEGVTLAELPAKVEQVDALHAQYEAAKKAGTVPEGTSFEDFIIGGAFAQYQAGVQAKVVQALKAGGMEETAAEAAAAAMMKMTQEELAAAGVSPELIPAILSAQDVSLFLKTDLGKSAAAQAEQAGTLWSAMKKAGGKEAFLTQLEWLQENQELLTIINGTVIPGANEKINEINRMIRDLTRPTAQVVGELADLCMNGGDLDVVDDLKALSALCRDLLKTLKDHEGEGAELLDDLNEAGDLLERITHTADGLLDQVDSLTEIVNTYEPTLQGVLTDVQTLSGSLQSTLHDTSSALAAAEELLRESGPQLDAGTRNTLNGVSASLRKAAVGLGEMDTVRNARETVKTLMDDEWDSHTGEVDGLLNIDAGAEAVSMTDPRNPAPGSVQYVMRTQEIKAEEEAVEAVQQEEEAATTFWGRVAAMFRGIWEGFKRLLHIG